MTISISLDPKERRMHARALMSVTESIGRRTYAATTTGQQHKVTTAGWPERMRGDFRRRVHAAEALGHERFTLRLASRLSLSDNQTHRRRTSIFTSDVLGNVAHIARFVCSSPEAEKG
jgi:hypothetical protein